MSAHYAPDGKAVMPLLVAAMTRALSDWLGRRSIQHTVRYTELNPARFKDFWAR